MYEIQANTKGSRHITINDEHLETIEKYALFNGLVSSTGIIDDVVVEKLRMNVRSLIDVNSDNNDLLVFCKEVLYHDNMKPFGLSRLVELYTDWKNKRREADEANAHIE